MVITMQLFLKLVLALAGLGTAEVVACWVVLGF
jgi:hypothetical protein